MPAASSRSLGKTTCSTNTEWEWPGSHPHSDKEQVFFDVSDVDTLPEGRYEYQQQGEHLEPAADTHRMDGPRMEDAQHNFPSDS